MKFIVKSFFQPVTLLAFVSILLVCSCGRSEATHENECLTSVTHEQFEENKLGFCPDSLRCQDGKVKSGQFFSTLLGSLGMTAQQAYNLTQACDTLFDVRTLRVGNTYKAYYSSGDQLEYLVYDRDRMHQVVFDCTEPYDLWIYEKQ